MFKYTRVRKKKQHWQEISCRIPLTIVRDIESWVQGFTKTKKQLLNEILNAHFAFRGVMYFRQDTLANRIGCSRGTVSRLLSELEHDGFVISNYRHKTSCLYKISRTLYDPFIQSRLGHIFSILRYLSELFQAARFRNNVKQFINNKYN